MNTWLLCVNALLLAVALHSSNAITTLIKATDLVHYGCGDAEYMGECAILQSIVYTIE